MSSIGRFAHSTSALSLLIGLGLVAAASSANAVTVAPGYSLSVFAGPLMGSSAPDSIAVAGGNVFVGYGNGGNPEGSGGAMSQIVEYNSTGAFVGSITVTGHNDGLRYNAATGQLWALQNEDAHPNLVLINPSTLSPAAPLSFSGTPHGGGYDDVAFGANGTFISASNPANNPNTGPAVVSATIGGGLVNVSGVLNGNATASVINGGGTTTLNLQDPDSMTFAPSGALVLDSQADQQLVYVNGVGTGSQAVSVLNLPSTVDDTAFAAGGLQRMLFTDRGSGIVYALTGNFGAGQAISAADTLNQIVLVDQSTGAFTTVVSGLNGPHGEAFLTSVVPEPATWSMIIVGLCGVGLLLRRHRPLPAAAV
jgi:hypothetical protein